MMIKTEINTQHGLSAPSLFVPLPSITLCCLSSSFHICTLFSSGAFFWARAGARQVRCEGLPSPFYRGAKQGAARRRVHLLTQVQLAPTLGQDVILRTPPNGPPPPHPPVAEATVLLAPEQACCSPPALCGGVASAAAGLPGPGGGGASFSPGHWQPLWLLPWISSLSRLCTGWAFGGGEVLRAVTVPCRSRAQRCRHGQTRASENLSPEATGEF